MLFDSSATVEPCTGEPVQKVSLSVTTDAACSSYVCWVLCKWSDLLAPRTAGCEQWTAAVAHESRMMQEQTWCYPATRRMLDSEFYVLVACCSTHSNSLAKDIVSNKLCQVVGKQREVRNATLIQKVWRGVRVKEVLLDEMRRRWFKPMYEDIYIQEGLYNYTLYRSGNSIRGTKVFSPRTSIGSSLNTKQHLENDCRYSMYSMRIHGAFIDNQSIWDISCFIAVVHGERKELSSSYNNSRCLSISLSEVWITQRHLNWIDSALF